MGKGNKEVLCNEKGGKAQGTYILLMTLSSWSYVLFNRLNQWKVPMHWAALSSISTDLGLDFEP